MSLKILPSELLRHIFNGQSSWAVIQLYMCGDTTLNIRLMNKGVTEVDLRCSYSNSTSRWPRCLKYFKLDHLSVECRKDTLGTPLMLANELKQQHVGLKYLKLVFKDAERAFFLNLNPTQPTPILPLEPPTKRPKLHDTDDNNTLHLEPWLINLTWPDLEHLELSSAGSWVTPTISSDLLPRLPQSLASLKLDFILPNEDYTHLPPNIKTLHSRPWTLTKTDLRKLPTSITDLGEFGW